jgi:hypothetical protein
MTLRNVLQTIALVLTALTLVACGDCYIAYCAPSESEGSSPSSRMVGVAVVTDCGVTVKTDADIPNWVGTPEFYSEICLLVGRVSELAGLPIDTSLLTVTVQRQVYYQQKPTDWCGVESQNRYTGASFVRYVARDVDGCSSNTALTHELLHVVLEPDFGGDVDHNSPLWRTIPAATADCEACARTAAAAPR